MHDSPVDPASPVFIADDCIATLADQLESLEALDLPRKTINACLLGYGWWASVLRTADAVRNLYQLGFAHEASPLVRTILLHTATLEWLAREPERVVTVVTYEHAYRRYRLYEQARKKGWSLAGLDDTKQPAGPKPSGLHLLREPEKLCEYVEMPNSYIPFMIESSYVHPSGIGGDRYLHREGNETMLRPTASSPPVELRASALFGAMAMDAYGRLIGRSDWCDLAAEIGRKLGVGQVAKLVHC